MRLNRINITKGQGGLIGAIVTTILFAVAALSPWATYTQIALAITPVTALLYCGLIFSVVWAVAAPNRISFSNADILFIGYFGFAFMSYFWSQKPSAWAPQFLWYFVCCLIYLQARIFITTETRMNFLAIGSLLGLLIGYSMLETITDEWGNINSRQNILEHNANFTAYIFSGTLFVFFALLFRQKKSYPHHALLLTPILFIIGSALLKLDTRGAILSASAITLWAFLYQTFLYRFKKRIKLKATLSVIFVLCTFVSFGFGEWILLNIDQLHSRSTGDLTGRLPNWEVAREIIRQHTLLGVGVGSFQQINPYEIGAHNLFLTLMLETGIFGFISFFAGLYFLLTPGLSTHSSRYQHFATGLFLAYLVPIVMSGHWELSPFSWLILGIFHNAIRTDVAAG